MTKEELLERARKEGTLIFSEDADNSAIENIKNNPEVKNYSLMIGFAQKYGVLTFSRIEKKIKRQIDRSYKCYCFDISQYNISMAQR